MGGFTLQIFRGGGMNEENLKGHGFHERTASEQREIAQKGGKASGEARRKKADFKKTLNTLLTTKIDNSMTPILEALGLDSTLESALNMAMIQKGLSGDVKAYEAIAKYSGQSAQTDFDDEEQKIKIDRARQARDREIGNTDNSDENIQSFINAINPTKHDIEKLFSEGNINGAETE